MATYPRNIIDMAHREGIRFELNENGHLAIIGTPSLELRAILDKNRVAIQQLIQDEMVAHDALTGRN